MVQVATEADDQRLTAGHWLLLLVLAAIQVMHIVDFMILMPLAPQLQADLGLSIFEFSVVISVYGFSAGICGLLLASALDRFDRKAALLILFAGFTAGTAVCAVAPSYSVLLVGRVLAGGFGGVAASVVLAIVGDAFPVSRRGTAMGVVMSGFSVASVAGVPAGLLFAEHSTLGWRAPFAILAVASLALLALAWVALPAVRGHLNGFRLPISLWQVATRPAHLRAYALMAALVFSTFMVVPYIATFLVKNVGIAEPDVKLVYLAGGAATLISMNLIGRLADYFDRLTCFRVLAFAALLTILVLTNLPPGTSLVLTLIGTTSMFIFTSGRMVPGMALITSVAQPRDRGSFLSVNSAVQQFAAGLAPQVSALVMSENEGGPIVGFPYVGVLAGLMALLSIYLIGLLPQAKAGVVLQQVDIPAGQPERNAAPADERTATIGNAVTTMGPPADFSDMNA